MSESLLIRQWLKEKNHTHNIYGVKCDKNGYTPNIFGFPEDKCVRCERYTETVRHEVYQGADRNTAKAMGWWLPLCPHCHLLFHAEPSINENWQRKMQIRFEQEHEHDDFMELIGKDYK